MLTPTAELVHAAQAANSAVAAFNVITVEHAEAIAEAAETTGHPVILQLSQNAVAYHRGAAAIAAACREIARTSTAALALHLDHVEDVELLHQAADLGVGSVMFDASTLPERENIAATRAAADWAHRHGLWVEAELGEIGGKSSAHTPGVRTDPAEASRFVAATGVDGLAVAVGSSHAMVQRRAELDLELIDRLHAAVLVPLVLHGSSGVPDETLRAAVSHGMVKINVGTLLNIAFTGAVRAALTQRPELVDPRRYLGPARTATAEVVAQAIRVISEL
ncbi:MAG TPA: class II fructose-bisphosphate aldolase [Pseudonocardiaceae bacterium]|jgi:fructose-bisphosphate aldolase class II|nr:class II fructose-bisphosphate aldolase [Pseudonocardiaceae bacterium]